MNILVLLIPISLILGGVGVLAFIYALKSRQFEDSQGNAARVLIEDD